MSALLQSAVKSGGLTRLALPPAFRLTLLLQVSTGGLTRLALPPAYRNAAVCKSGRCHRLGHRPPFTVQRYVRPFAPLVNRGCYAAAVSFTRSHVCASLELTVALHM